MSICANGLLNLVNKANLIQQVCWRSGVPRNANAPEHSPTQEDLA
jgi:hypothetical protein